MHREHPGRFRDVALAVGQHPLDVFPLDPRQRRRVDRQLAGTRLQAALERIEDAVGVGRLGEVVRGAEANGLERGGDAAVASTTTAVVASMAFTSRTTSRPDMSGNRMSTTAISGLSAVAAARAEAPSGTPTAS